MDQSARSADHAPPGTVDPGLLAYRARGLAAAPARMLWPNSSGVEGPVVQAVPSTSEVFCEIAFSCSVVTALVCSTASPEPHATAARGSSRAANFGRYAKLNPLLI
jgi:hypothetical protein